MVSSSGHFHLMFIYKDLTCPHVCGAALPSPNSLVTLGVSPWGGVTLCPEPFGAEPPSSSPGCGALCWDFQARAVAIKILGCEKKEEKTKNKNHSTEGPMEM